MFPRIGRTVKCGRVGGLQCVLRQLAVVSLVEKLPRIGTFEARHGSPQSSSLTLSSTGEMGAVWVQSRGRGRAVTFCIRMPIFAYLYLGTWSCYLHVPRISSQLLYSV